MPVPFVADAAGQAEAQRQALERNPAPRGARLIVYGIYYGPIGVPIPRAFLAQIWVDIWVGVDPLR